MLRPIKKPASNGPYERDLVLEPLAGIVPATCRLRRIRTGWTLSIGPIPVSLF